MDSNNNQSIDYKVVYSRRRSIGINIGPDSGVTVRAPYRTSLKTIQSMVQSKSAWIIKHLEKYKSATRISSKIIFANGTSVLFRGKEYPVRFIKSEKYFIRFDESNIEIGLINPEEKEKAGLMLEKWYRVISEGIFRRKFDELLIRFSRYNFTPAEFSVRVLKRRWGSCSSKGKITISSELVKLDDIYLEYVILHELCHIRHHNHGKEFYALLSEVFPDWKQKRSELRKYIR
jgi:predicted metal-dependent hydrolase